VSRAPGKPCPAATLAIAPVTAAPASNGSDRSAIEDDGLTARPLLARDMPADLHEKTDRYHDLLAEAVDAVEVCAPEDTPMGEAALECLEMATSYLDDGEHFRANDDPVNALAAFSYGHAWLDAGARIGLFDVPREGHLFTQ
jgi:hypothetical protein